MKRNSLLYSLAVLLWLLATNHCGIELAVAAMSDKPTNAAATPDGHCPSHSKSDAGSHTEGKSCGTSVLPEGKTAQVLVVNDSVFFFQSVFNSSVITDDFLPSPITPTKKVRPPKSLYSITVRSNAPPILA